MDVEAYVGPQDKACHASKGRTKRTEVLFGPPGHTYVYLIYGMYHLLNFVTERLDFPAAILIRGIEIVEQGNRKNFLSLSVLMDQDACAGNWTLIEPLTAWMPPSANPFG